MNKKLAIAILLATMAVPVSAQRTDLLGRSEIFVAGGGFFYIGDLNNQSAIDMPQWGASLGLRTRLDNRWVVRAAFSYGQLECDKDYITRRNLSFRSPIFEGAAMIEFDFRPYGPGATENVWTPFIFGGLAIFHYNPQALYTEADGNSRWVALQPLHTEGQATSVYPHRRPYRLTQLNMPFGVGVRWRVSKSISLTVEYGFRNTWTDYLDDVSTTYVGAELLSAEVTNGGMAAILADRSSEVEAGFVNPVGMKRGDDSLNDWYSYFNASISISMETLLGWTRSKRCKL